VKILAPALVCRDAVELMNDYVDGTLTRRVRRRLERHLADCPACSAYLVQLRSTIAASGSIDPDDVDPETLEALVDLFRKVRGADDGESRRPGE
jgi:anti-sigma factor RsiW